MTRAPSGNSSRQPNNVFAECRATLNLSYEKLAYLVCEKAKEHGTSIGTLDSVTRHIKRIEAGDVRDPSQVYKSLLCAVLKKTESVLFGTVSLRARHDNLCNSTQTRTFRLRNHKLIPTFIGPNLAERAIDNLGMQAENNPTHCYRRTLSHARNEVTSDLWIWPFGVALFHLVEEIEFSDLANFAIWHRRVYDEQMQWANKITESLLGSNASAQYAMPINWIIRSIWTKPELGTALRILTTPRMLLQRTAHAESSDLAHAELVERAFFQGGFDQPGITEFSIDGTSVGIASWSGIAYLPIAPHRALSESEILTYERTVQAAWSYCDWIRSQVEVGNDPSVRPQHGRRLLRALRSIITNPRPEENPQVYPLRIAILATSGITEHLNQATDAIAELEG